MKPCTKTRKASREEYTRPVGGHFEFYNSKNAGSELEDLACGLAQREVLLI